jgi:hypothetical protein
VYKLAVFMHTNYRGLALLLSIGSLPIACTKEPNDTAGDDSTTGSTTSNSTTGTTGTTGTDTTDPTGTPDPTSTGGTTTTTMGQTDTTATTTEPQATTFLTSESETADTGFETGDTGLPPATDPNCIAFGKHMAECIPRLAEYAEYLAQDCEYSKMSGMVDGPDCVEAMDAFFVCLTMADCADLKENTGACQKEQDAMDAACPGFDDSDTDSDPNSTDASSG